MNKFKKLLDKNKKTEESELALANVNKPHVADPHVLPQKNQEIKESKQEEMEKPISISEEEYKFLKKKLSKLHALLLTKGKSHLTQASTIRVIQFSDFASAQALKTELKELGFTTSPIEKAKDNDNSIFLALEEEKYQTITSLFWKAYGDGSFFEEKSTQNREMAIQMVCAGLKDVFRAFEGTSLTNGYKKYWPNPESPKYERNHFPMFRNSKVQPKVVEKRKNLSETQHLHESHELVPPKSTHYEQEWNAKAALKERDIDAIDEGLGVVKDSIFHSLKH